MFYRQPSETSSINQMVTYGIHTASDAKIKQSLCQPKTAAPYCKACDGVRVLKEQLAEGIEPTTLRV